MTEAVLWSEWFWRQAATHLWQTSLALAMVWLVARRLRDAPARWSAALWLACALKLMVPLALVAPLTAALLRRATAGSPALADAGTAGAVTVAWLYPPLLEIGVQAPHPSPLSVGWTVVWLAIAGWLAARRLLAAARGRPGGRPGLDALPGTLRTRLRRAAARAGLPPGAIAVTGDGDLPSVAGLLRPRVLISPRLVASLDDDQLHAVLCHEDRHRRRRDPLRSLLVGLVSAVWFFYPPVWWLGRRMREAAELACDEAVLAAGIPPERYRRALAGLLLMQLDPAGAGAEASIRGPRPSFVQRRLRRLTPARSITMTRTHRLLFASGLAVLLAATLVPMTAPSLADPAAAGAGAEDRSAELQRLAAADTPVQLEFDKTDVERILKMVATTSGIQFVFAQKLPPAPVSISTGRVPLADALDRLGRAAGLTYTVLDERTVSVRPATLLAGTAGVSTPTVVEAGPNPYPDDARRAKVEGQVILQAVIDRTGSVRDVQVLRSSRPDYPSFAEAAIETVKGWVYEPATLDGAAVDVYFTIVIDYSLDDQDSDTGEGTGV